MNKKTCKPFGTNALTKPKKLSRSEMPVISGRPAFNSIEFGKKDQPFSTEINPKIMTGIIEASSRTIPLKYFPQMRNKMKVMKIRNKLSYLVKGIKAEIAPRRIKSFLFKSDDSSSDTRNIYKTESQICITCSKPVNIRGGRGEINIISKRINKIAGFFRFRFFSSRYAASSTSSAKKRFRMIGTN